MNLCFKGKALFIKSNASGEIIFELSASSILDAVTSVCERCMDELGVYPVSIMIEEI